MFPTILFGFGLFLALVVLFDFPVKSRFTPDAIERVTPLRIHRISWDRVVFLERARGSRVARLRVPSMGSSSRLEGPPEHRPATFGGLTARTGEKRRYLLTNQVESRDEFKDLITKIQFWSPGTVIKAKVPPEAATPSYLYRRGYKPGA